MNLIERIDGVNYIQLEQYVRVCEELKDANEEHQKLLDAIHNEDLNTANSEMSNKVRKVEDWYQVQVDELNSQNHDLQVMVATLLYVLGVRE